MHATERETAILRLLEQQDGFVAFRELEGQLDASPATLRRDLNRLADEGYVDRVLVDHTKFQGPSGNVVCGLEEVDGRSDRVSVIGYRP